MRRKPRSPDTSPEAAFLPEAEWKDVFAFGILIVVLIIRPSGILGERTADKI